jgi:hypothetical protein
MICDNKDCCLERFWLYRWKQAHDVKDCYINIGLAGDKLRNQEFEQAGNFLIDAADNLSALVCEMLYGAYWYEPSHWADYRWLELDMADPPIDVTMESILSAMLDADPSEVLYFIGLVDAYRQSVWNQPFNKDYYASLARGFEQWE